MPDDPVPTPPGPQDQGLPPRAAPYAIVPGSIQFTRCNPVEGQPEALIVLIYDSSDIRLVSYWTESAFTALANRMLMFIAEPNTSLTVADMDDLKKLRDATPFERP